MKGNVTIGTFTMMASILVRGNVTHNRFANGGDNRRHSLVVFPVGWGLVIPAAMNCTTIELTLLVTVPWRVLVGSQNLKSWD